MWQEDYEIMNMRKLSLLLVPNILSYSLLTYIYVHDGVNEVHNFKLVINVALINLCSLFCDFEHIDLSCVDTIPDRGGTEVIGAI
jgi:hypothetical protein